MRRIRVIPTLLLKDNGLVKTRCFKNEVYIGDPINAVKIFNEKEIDEIIILDIDATIQSRGPDFAKIADIAGECFMPLCYGGGITTIEEIKKLFFIGIEKISLNTSAVKNPQLISQASKLFGSQSVVISIDVKKKNFDKYYVFINRGKTNTKKEAVAFAKEMEDRGAGEILLTSIGREGTFTGYDWELIQKVSQVVNIPIIACGGAKDADDFVTAVKYGASAVAAGSMFVFKGKLRGILINFPSQNILSEKLYSVNQ
ncbi:MAG: AglZ/HisF2 family acetamidino modification protein [Bacteroidota bacterium]